MIAGYCRFAKELQRHSISMISVHSISNSFLNTGQHRLKTGRLIIHYFVGQNLEYCHVQFEVYIYIDICMEY
jgi:hypothetical protein